MINDKSLRAAESVGRPGQKCWVSGGLGPDTRRQNMLCSHDLRKTAINCQNNGDASGCFPEAHDSRKGIIRGT